MPHSIDTDDPLIRDAQALSGLVSPAEVVDTALREFIARRRQSINGLAGEPLPDRPQAPRSARGLCRGMDPSFERDEAER